MLMPYGQKKKVNVFLLIFIPYGKKNLQNALREIKSAKQHLHNIE